MIGNSRPHYRISTRYKIYNNGKNGVGVGHKQARKEEEFEVSKSSSNYKRILIVDDEPDIAISLKMVLESSNDDDKQKIKFDVHFIHRSCRGIIRLQTKLL